MARTSGMSRDSRTNDEERERQPDIGRGELPTEDGLQPEASIDDTSVYQGDPEALGGEAPSGGPEVDPLTETDPRVDETNDPSVAAEEGVPWVAPIDPPTVGSDDQGNPKIAAGFSVDATAEPYDQDHHDGLMDDEGEVGHVFARPSRPTPGPAACPTRWRSSTPVARSCCGASWTTSLTRTRWSTSWSGSSTWTRWSAA